MTNINADIKRVEATAVNIPTTLINNQLGFDTTNSRIAYKDSGGTMHYFEKSTSANPTDITLTDNTADAFKVREATNNYIHIATTNSSEVMSFGNASTNPEHVFLGTGGFGVGLSSLTEKFHIKEEKTGIVRAVLENNSASAAAVVGALYEVRNDNGYWGGIGMTNSGSTIQSGSLVNTYQNYNQGYGDFLFTNDGDVDFVWYSDPTDSHDFSALSNEVMRLTADGDLGIGRVPTTRLDVYDATDNVELTLETAKENGNARYIAKNDAREWRFGVINDDSFVIVDQTGAEQRLIIDTSGNVGIGRAPTSKLDIYDASSNVEQIIESGKANGNARLYFKNDAREYRTGVTADDYYVIRDQNAGTDRLIIDTSGNVGIGGTPSDTILGVYGDSDVADVNIKIHNSKQENIDDGRESALYFSGEKFDGTVEDVAGIIATHDGIGDDGLGKVLLGGSTGLGGDFKGITVYSDGDVIGDKDIESTGDLISGDEVRVGSNIVMSDGGVIYIGQTEIAQTDSSDVESLAINLNECGSQFSINDYNDRPILSFSDVGNFISNTTDTEGLDIYGHLRVYAEPDDNDSYFDVQYSDSGLSAIRVYEGDGDYIDFGNPTTEPIYNFMGTNPTNHGGDVRIVSDTYSLKTGAGSDFKVWYDGTDARLTSDEVTPSDIILDCGTEKTMELAETVWEDLRIVPGAFSFSGSSDPTIENWTIDGVTYKVYKFKKNHYHQVQHTLLNGHIYLDPQYRLCY